jgi:TonB family protein
LGNRFLRKVPSPGNLYTNKTLGLTWEIPANWQVKNDPAQAPAHTQILLEALPNGAQSGESVAMIGIDHDHFNEDSPPPTNRKTWLPLPKQNADPELGDLTLGNGLPVHRYDFRSAQEPVRYLTFLSGPRNGYGVDFVILANSSEHLEEIIHTLVEMKIRPDWPANSPPIGGHVQSLDQAKKSARLSDKAISSHLKRRVAPEYPLAARDGGIGGVVKLLAHIGTDGTIKDVYLLSGPLILRNPAIAAVSQWRYQPYLVQEKPVEVETNITIAFGPW